MNAHFDTDLRQCALCVPAKSQNVPYCVEREHIREEMNIFYTERRTERLFGLAICKEHFCFVSACKKACIRPKKPSLFIIFDRIKFSVKNVIFLHRWSDSSSIRWTSDRPQIYNKIHYLWSF